MPAVGARHLGQATYRAFKLRAAHNGRSTEAGIGHVLVQPVLPPKKNAQDRLGTGRFRPPPQAPEPSPSHLQRDHQAIKAGGRA
jgi:plasmid stability protein